MDQGPDDALQDPRLSEPPTVAWGQGTHGTPTYAAASAGGNAGSPQLVRRCSQPTCLGTGSPESPTVACQGWSNQQAGWISQSIRRGTPVDHQTLRGRETGLEALSITW